MYVRSLRILGLAALPEFHTDALGRQVTIRGPSRQATAIGDGLSLIFAALSESGLRQLLVRWGVAHNPADIEVEKEGTPIQATWSNKKVAASLVADHTQRKIQADAELVLDPPLCTELRALAAREPRLAVGLGADQSVKISVSAFFGQSWDVMSISVQSLIVGGERFATIQSERSPWLNWLLDALGHRFISHDESSGHAEQALAFLTSADEQEHRAYQHWATRMNVHYPHNRVAKHGEEEAIFIADDRPLSRWGPEAMRLAEQMGTATLQGADVMWLGEHRPELDTITEGDQAPLEQLWVVHPEGTIDPTQKPTRRSVLAFGESEE